MSAIVILLPVIPIERYPENRRDRHARLSYERDVPPPSATVTVLPVQSGRLHQIRPLAHRKARREHSGTSE